MREITVHKDIEAPRGAVWEVLADFPGIANWNTGVKNSYSTNDSIAGVGAQRHCDLAPMGTLEETIAEWDEGERMVVSIDSATKLPLTNGRATFTLADREGVTPTTVRYEYTPRFGSIGAALMGRMLDRQFRSGFTGFLDDLDSAARSRATS